jgi:tellurite resistance protein TerC
MPELGRVGKAVRVATILGRGASATRRSDVMQQSWGWWIGFNVAVLIMLALDLGVFHRKSHEVKFKEAIFWSVVWTLAAGIFNLGLWLGWFGAYPPELRGRAALEFLTGYLIERSLSFDNLFVFAVIFSYFAVPRIYHHRVLFWGILGALVFRAIFIFGGLELIRHFEWMVLVFGGFLILTGIKLAVSKDQEIQPERNPMVRLMRKLVPLSDHYVGGKFVARVEGRRLATPLLLVLVFLETTDVIFALDSIPAIIGITRDAFVVYTSNVFAILGLRALYFVLAAFMKMFAYLTYGLALLLVFIGGKMLVEPLLGWHLPIGVALGAVAVILAGAVVASLLWPPKGVANPDAEAERG